MAPTTTNAHEDEHSHRRLERDIRSAISSLTRHLTALGKSAAPLSHSRDITSHDREGVRVITLKGSNNGAALKVDGIAVDGQVEETQGTLLGDEKAVRAYTNSNYQAVNNSVFLGGSCTAEDPGVHISFLDFEEERGKKKGSEEY